MKDFITSTIKTEVAVKYDHGFYFNSFQGNASLMEKPGAWFLLAKCVKSTNGRVTFSVKIQVIDQHLYLKCHSSTGDFYTFRQ